MSSTKFHIFPSILKVLRYYLPSFMAIGFLENLQNSHKYLPMIKGKSITQKLHMQWLPNFNQSFYYTRLAYPQNFIIFGSQKLQIWFKQVCMHSQTHFKFQFNSSKFSTTSAHVIFFLNTRLHYDPNKIRSTQFGSTNLEIYILQNNIKTG